MVLSKQEIQKQFQLWVKAWEEYDLDAVMDFMHDDVCFENWDGLIVNGKTPLQKLWTPWFLFNKGFKFITEAFFIDEGEQKIAFQWKYEGPSFEKNYKALPELRSGVDIIDLQDGKIIRKSSYSKTHIQINNSALVLSALK